MQLKVEKDFKQCYDAGPPLSSTPPSHPASAWGPPLESHLPVSEHGSFPSRGTAGVLVNGSQPASASNSEHAADKSQVPEAVSGKGKKKKKVVLLGMQNRRYS